MSSYVRSLTLRITPRATGSSGHSISQKHHVHAMIFVLRHCELSIVFCYAVSPMVTAFKCIPSRISPLAFPVFPEYHGFPCRRTMVLSALTLLSEIERMCLSLKMTQFYLYFHRAVPSWVAASTMISWVSLIPHQCGQRTCRAPWQGLPD